MSNKKTIKKSPVSNSGESMTNINFHKGHVTHWRLLAPLCVISAGVLWGIIGLFTKELGSIGLDSIQMTETRCFIAFTALFIIAAIKDPALLKIRLRDIWIFIGTGVISIAFFNICYFTCINQSSLSVAVILLYTGPCFVMILSCILFHEKFTALKGISLISAILGCAFITGIIGTPGGFRITWLAFIIGLGSGLGYGLYSIFGRVALKRYQPLTVTVYTFLFAAVSLLPLSHPSQIIEMTTLNTQSILSTLLLGLLSTLSPFLLYTKGLEHMETGKASMFTFVEPVVATIISIAVFHEAFTLNHVIGMIAIIGSITLLNIKDLKRNKH